MKNENMQDLYDKMLEAQEADMEARGMMDAPDSFQIAGIEEDELSDELEALKNAESPTEEEPEMASDEEIKQLLGELWDEVLPLTVEGVGNVTVLDQNEYTERDAFDDFMADQQEDWN